MRKAYRVAMVRWGYWKLFAGLKFSKWINSRRPVVLFKNWVTREAINELRRDLSSRERRIYHAMIDKDARDFWKYENTGRL